MKKILFYAVAFLSMTMAWSCQQDQLDTAVAKDGDLVEVTFELSAGDLQTKAVIGHTPDFNKTLAVGVYRNGVYLANANPVVTSDFGTGLEAKVKVILVKGQKYDIAFWADAKPEEGKVEDYYSVDFAAVDPLDNTKNYPLVTVDYEVGAANDIHRDAWCAVLEDYKVTDKSIEGETVVLNRPLAQVNVGTKDYQLAVNAGVTVTGSAMTVMNAATQLNMFTGATSDPVEVVMERSTIPYCFTSDPRTTLTVYNETQTPEEYQYLALNYILVSDDSEAGYGKDIVTVKLKFYEDNNPAPVNDLITVTNVPVRRNFRTNLIADDVITQESVFTIKIDPYFYGEYVNGYDDRYTSASIDKILYKNDKGEYQISTPEQLSFLAEVVNGGYNSFKGQTILVTGDIDLAGYKFDPIGTANNPFEGTFDGQLPTKSVDDCATIYNLVVESENHAGLFGYVAGGLVQNLNIDGASVTGKTYVGGLVAHLDGAVKNCAVMNSAVENLAAKLDGTETYLEVATGGVVGYASETSTIENASAEETTVKAEDYTGSDVGFQGDKELVSFSVEGTQIKVAADAVKAEFKVVSNVAWTVTVPEGVTAEPAAGEGNATVVLGFAANEDTENQVVYEVKVATEAEIEGNEVTVTVTQDKAEKVVEPEEPVEPEVVTVAEFLAAAEATDVWYELTGTITNISNTTYGNFDIQDETGSIYVYGLTATKVEKNDKSFSTLGLEVGDVVTLIGTRASYNGSAQVGGPAYYVSHVKGEEPEIPVGSNVAEITFSTMGYDNSQNVDGVTISIDDNVNVVFRKGGASTAPAYYDSGAAIRMYQNGATMDITAAGKTITSIEITFANNHYYVAADSGELSAESSVRTWTGSAEAVKFTSTGTDKDHRAYVSAIKVIYE